MRGGGGGLCRGNYKFVKVKVDQSEGGLIRRRANRQRNVVNIIIRTFNRFKKHE